MSCHASLEAIDQIAEFLKNNPWLRGVAWSLWKCGIGGRLDGLLFCDPNDGMKMIGHDTIRIQNYFCSNVCGPQPFIFHNFSQRIEMHLGLKNRSKEVLFLMGTHGNEVCSI